MSTVVWGKPWDHKLNLADIWNNDDLSFIERRDAIVERIKATRWYKRAEERDDELFYIVDELSDAKHEDEFDVAWDGFYDWCDVDKRVWIELWSRST